MNERNRSIVVAVGDSIRWRLGPPQVAMSSWHEVVDLANTGEVVVQADIDHTVAIRLASIVAWERGHV